MSWGLQGTSKLVLRLCEAPKLTALGSTPDTRMGWSSEGCSIHLLGTGRGEYGGAQSSPARRARANAVAALALATWAPNMTIHGLPALPELSPCVGLMVHECRVLRSRASLQGRLRTVINLR